MVADPDIDVHALDNIIENIAWMLCLGVHCLICWS